MRRSSTLTKIFHTFSIGAGPKIGNDLMDNFTVYLRRRIQISELLKPEQAALVSMGVPNTNEC